MKLIWIYDCSKQYAETHQNEPGVVFGEPKTDPALVGYYIDPEKIRRCDADMENETEDDIEEL